MPDHSIHIAIIGGGASGTITAIQLLRKLTVKAKVYLIEKKPAVVYRGAAYSSQLNYEPLNVPAGRMSIFNHLPDDFFQWIVTNKPEVKDITRDSFVSRRWFGDYMTDTIRNAAEKSKCVALEIVTSEARDIAAAGSAVGYNLLLADGRMIYTDYLIFATGNETPADVLSREEVVNLGDAYVSNPWVGNTLERVKNTDDVLVIGTGLTMIDHVVSLAKTGHEGKIFCLSRNGYLPLEHTFIQDTIVTIPDDVKDIHRLVKELKLRVAEASSKKIKWQNVMDALRPRTSRLWRNLDVASKKYFLKRLKPFWEIHRHRMPTASAIAIKEMTGAGQLHLLSGSIISTERTGNKIVFRYYCKQLRTTKAITVNFVINCTGPLSDYQKCDNLLIKNLLNKGWMQQDELKLGVRTGMRGEVMRDTGVVLQNAYAIGPLRKAMEWESTAVREIRTHAEQVAFLIAEQTERKQDMMVEIGL